MNKRRQNNEWQTPSPVVGPSRFPIRGSKGCCNATARRRNALCCRPVQLAFPEDVHYDAVPCVEVEQALGAEQVEGFSDK
jgi:hypothetical protein